MHYPVPPSHPSSPYCTLIHLQYTNANISVKDFMQAIFDPQDKLDEIAIVFSHNYYKFMTLGIQQLATLYSETSVSE